MVKTTDIIQKNLSLMISYKNCGMFILLEKESIGARGFVIIEGKRYGLMFANFYYDRETGEILCFSNREESLIGNSQGTFKIVADFKRDPPYFKIIGVTLDENASKQANRVLMSCVNIYNTTYEQVEKKVA